MDENVARAFGKAFESKLFRSSATLQGLNSKGAPGASGTTKADSDSGQTDALRTWAREEFARHHWPTILDAGRAIAEFDTRSWIRGVDVPTTVMLTKRDRLVSPAQQQDMADRIPGARIESVDAGHFACVREDFGPRILRSARRIEHAMAWGGGGAISLCMSTPSRSGALVRPKSVPGPSGGTPSPGALVTPKVIHEV